MDFDWWSQRLELKSGSNEREYWALCPSPEHVPPDRNPSLHLTVRESGAVLVHCFRGCSYSSIVQAVAGQEWDGSINAEEATGEGAKAGVWFSEYVGLPAEFIESQSVRTADDRIAFVFGTSGTQKVRRAGTDKEIRWVLSGGVAPPSLWPEVGERVGTDIWIAEGETDTLILRYLGFEAYGLTKGAETVITEAEFRALQQRGAEALFVCLDVDAAGRKGAKRIVEAARQVGLQAYDISIGEYIDVLAGMKDIRAWWLHSGRDAYTVIEGLQALRERAGRQAVIPKFITLEELLRRTVEREPWLVDGIWVRGSIGVLTGNPKVGKSFLVCDLAVSVATGKPFLGEFAVRRCGAVVYLPKEDTLADLQDRFAKILLAKGLGGGGEFPKIYLPPVINMPVSLNSRQDFVLSDLQVELLIRHMEEQSRGGSMPELVILDPVLRMLDEGADLWRAEVVATKIFNLADRIRRSTGAAVLIVHHRPKHSLEETSSYGSTAFRAFSESALYVQGQVLPRPGGNAEWCKVIGEFKSYRGTEFWYQFPELHSRYEVKVSREDPGGGEKPTFQVSNARLQAQDLVLEILSEVGNWMIFQEVEAAAKSRGAQVSSSTLRRALHELVERGLVDRQEGKMGEGPTKVAWRVVQEGEQR